MPRISAGLLMYRWVRGEIEVLLVHPGGPFFKNKDEGAWTIPKGEPDEDEDLLAAARREFEEETGLKASGPFIALASVKQRGGKQVYAWAFVANSRIGLVCLPWITRLSKGPRHEDHQVALMPWQLRHELLDHCDPGLVLSNKVLIQWPPGSGQTVEIPEIDRAEFFDLPTARRKINPAQVGMPDDLERQLADES